MEAIGNIVVMGGHAGHTGVGAVRPMERTDRHCVGEDTVGCVKASLDETLALRLGDKRLQFGSGESIDQAGFRDEKEDLCSGEG